MQSPNEMVVDSEDYVGGQNPPEQESVAIINPENLENDAEQLQDLPKATDRAGLYTFTRPWHSLMSA
jgi:ubiquitin carboxyl-terminal hydrolase 7